ncbi:MAG: hypothetical protein KAY32_04160 [Candidatus Eisenbacteria sp.]|nr:hypothetical protein [Candidatus Eisenbacteria bacterium]
MTATKFFALAALCTFLIASLTPSGAAPLQPAFTYQGHLEFEGQPVNDICDFQFWVYGELEGGTAAAGPLLLNEVQVSDGVFAVTLDFSPFEFTSSVERYLEIAVRHPSGGGSFSTLAPRERIAPTPFALKAKRADYASYAYSSGTAAAYVSDVTAALYGYTPPDVPPIEPVAILGLQPLGAGDVLVTATGTYRFEVQYNYYDIYDCNLTTSTEATGHGLFKLFGMDGDEQLISESPLYEQTHNVTWHPSAISSPRHVFSLTHAFHVDSADSIYIGLWAVIQTWDGRNCVPDDQDGWSYSYLSGSITVGSLNAVYIPEP